MKLDANSKRHTAVLLIALAALAAGAQAPRGAASLCAPFYDEMIAKGRAQRMSGGASPKILPLAPGADRIRAAIEAEKPGILVETAFFLPREDPSDQAQRRAELARVYGLLRSISSLEGIQYYSVTYKKMRTLYAESYRIDSPETKLRMADPPAPGPGNIPAEETIYAFQKDLSFGGNVYSYVFRGLEGAVSADMTNLTRMSVGIVPMVAPQGLKTRILVIPASDGIIFYAESDSSSAGIFQARLEESFANRAAALFEWFKAKSAAFVRP